MKEYDEKFYASQSNVKNLSSARVIREIIDDIIAPTSVVDVGCGTGCFLREFKNREILGIDSPWISDKQLLIPKERFIAADFTKGFPKVNRKFDLALCFEVAEHLDEAYANKLVKFLISLSDIVVFGAAIPNQLGVHHTNEQWQSYWTKKFQKNNYDYADCIRPKLWDRTDVLVWLKQNVLLYAKKERLRKFKEMETPIIDIVHPEFWYARTMPETVPMHLVLTNLKWIPKTTSSIL